MSPYPLVGNPDGLGAYDNGDDTFSLLVNHEFLGNAGAVHGARGAFISKWTLHKGNLRVLHGEDLIHSVMLWNGSAHVPSAAPVVFTRFCSGNLAARGAFYNATTGNGYDGQLYLNGEEASVLGRAFAHTLDGTSYQLPHLGRLSFENVLIHPDTGDRTVTVATDDAINGQVYVYIGQKGTIGTPVDRAGLTGGDLYGVRVVGMNAESDATTIAPGTRFSLYKLGNVSAMTGTQLQTATRGPDPAAFLVSEFNRPEDGHWDPNQPAHFYFNATATFDGNSRLWRLRFEDILQPESGGVIDMLLTGAEGHKQLDNMTVDGYGHVMLQEDPGASDRLAKLWRYDIATGQLDELAHQAAKFFDPLSGDTFITQAEETSGIIDVGPILGDGKYLLTAMAHKALGGELVEMGQLLALHAPPGQPSGD